MAMYLLLSDYFRCNKKSDESQERQQKLLLADFERIRKESIGRGNRSIDSKVGSNETLPAVQHLATEETIQKYVKSTFEKLLTNNVKSINNSKPPL